MDAGAPSCGAGVPESSVSESTVPKSSPGSIIIIGAMWTSILTVTFPAWVALRMLDGAISRGYISGPSNTRSVEAPHEMGKGFVYAMRQAMFCCI